jgi:galactokinase
MLVTPSLGQKAMDLLTNGVNQATRLFFAPGRANLLGSHMDYNGGWVMPVALSKGTYAAVTPNQSGRLTFRSAQFPGEAIDIPMKALHPDRAQGWSAYAEGAVYTATQAWGEMEGLDMAFCADLPMAKGLSSSASIESAVVFALAHWLNPEAQADEMIRLAHAAETQYVGVRCGILDQTAIFLAEKDSLLLFDCTELTREHLPLDGKQVEIAILDSGVARQLASSAFNARVAECTHALGILQQKLPGICCLRDVKRADFEKYAYALPSPYRQRVEHVVGEVERTVLGARALRKGDLVTFGKAMTDAHKSLKEFYEVSTPELDVLVDLASEAPGCFGSRLTGAGFGGCTVALVDPDHKTAFSGFMTEGYARDCGLPTEVQWFRPAGGPKEISLSP